MTNRPALLVMSAMIAAAMHCTPAALAQPVLTEHVPADTIVYLSWRGTDAAGEQYDASRLKAFLDESKLTERFGTVLAKLVELGGNDEQTRMLGGFIKHAMPAAIQRPWTFYVAGYDLDDDTQRPVPRIGFLIDPGDGPEGEAVVAWMVESFGDMQDDQVQLVEHGRLLGVIAGNAFVDPDADNAPKSLKTAEAFLATLKGLGDQPMLVGYVDVDAGLRTIGELTELEAGAGQAAVTRRVIEALGLSTARRAAATGSFDERDWVQRVFVDAPAPRKGLLALMEGKPVPQADLTKLSAQSHWFRTASLDPADVLKLIRETIDATGDEDTLIDFELGLKEASKTVGFDIEQDLINPAGAQWTIYSEPALGNIAGFYPGVALIHTLDDAAKVDASLIKFKDWANAEMDREGAGFKFVTMAFGDITIHSLGFPMVSPSWSVKDGRLYLAASASAITTADSNAAAGAAGGAGVTGAAGYQAVTQRLMALAGDGVTPTGIMYADLPRSAMSMYQSYIAVLNMMSGFMMGFGGDAGPNLAELLPPFNSIQPHLAPAGELMWADDKGLHIVSVQPFPGSTLLSPDAALSSGVGVPAFIPFTVGVMTPALGSARGTARQIQASTNARVIHQGMIILAQSQRGKPLTHDLSELIEANAFPPEYVLAPSSGIQLPVDFDEWEKDKRDNWIHKNASFVILPGLEEDLDSEIVAVFLKPSHSDGSRITVTFNDNATHLMPIKEAEELVKKQTGKTLDELVKAAEARAAEGTPDVLAESKARRAELIAEIRARRVTEE